MGIAIFVIVVIIAIILGTSLFLIGYALFGNIISLILYLMRGIIKLNKILVNFIVDFYFGGLILLPGGIITLPFAGMIARRKKNKEDYKEYKKARKNIRPVGTAKIGNATKTEEEVEEGNERYYNPLKINDIITKEMGEKNERYLEGHNIFNSYGIGGEIRSSLIRENDFGNYNNKPQYNFETEEAALKKLEELKNENN